IEVIHPTYRRCRIFIFICDDKVTHTENRGRQNSKILVTMWSFQCFPGDETFADFPFEQFFWTVEHRTSILTFRCIRQVLIPGKALEGPHGDKNFTVLSSPVFSMG